jgi:hypothetical protein
MPFIQKIYCCADITEDRKKEIFSCQDIQKVGNNVNYNNDHNVLFKKPNHDTVLNEGFCYIYGYMRNYTQVKKGLSYAFHKRIVCEDGIDTNH